MLSSPLPAPLTIRSNNCFILGQMKTIFMPQLSATAEGDAEREVRQVPASSSLPESFV